MNTHALEGKDSLLSIMQMPGGMPVGTLAIGKARRDQCGAAGDGRAGTFGRRRSPNGSMPGARGRRRPSPNGPKIEPLLKPGATIGILGGGQLARMLALAAAPLGLRFTFIRRKRILALSTSCTQAPVPVMMTKLRLGRFAGAVDVVTTNSRTYRPRRLHFSRGGGRCCPIRW